MASDRCSLCNKSAERAALVRCSDARCPLARTPQRVSIKTLVGMGVAGLLAVAAVGGIGMLANGSTADGAASAAEPAATAATANASEPLHATAQTDDGSSFAWLATLFEAPKPAAVEIPVDIPDPGRPDPRAGTRVQSFSCDGALTASRSLMCTRWDLATADYNLALSYKNALVHARNPRALRRARALWLQQLDALGSDAVRIQKHIEAFQRTITTA